MIDIVPRKGELQGFVSYTIKWPLAAPVDAFRATQNMGIWYQIVVAVLGLGIIPARFLAVVIIGLKWLVGSVRHRNSE